jgi:hypothetical protein
LAARSPPSQWCAARQAPRGVEDAGACHDGSSPDPAAGRGVQPARYGPNDGRFVLVRGIDQHDGGHLLGVLEGEEPHDKGARGVTHEHVRRGQTQHGEESTQLTYLPGTRPGQGPPVAAAQPGAVVADQRPVRRQVGTHPPPHRAGQSQAGLEDDGRAAAGPLPGDEGGVAQAHPSLAPRTVTGGLSPAQGHRTSLEHGPPRVRRSGRGYAVLVGRDSIPVLDRSPGRSPSPRGARLAAVLGLVGALVYSDWLVLEPIMGWRLSTVRSYISELGAPTTPHHALVNALDVLSGAFILLFAVRLVDLLPPAPKVRLGSLALAAFGLATVLGGRWPMTCAPSRDPDCSAGGLALHATPQDLAATGLSVAAEVAVLASMFWLTTALATEPATTRVRRRAARAAWLVLLTATALEVTVAVLGILDVGVGLPQRALVLLQSAWIAALAAAAWSWPVAPATAGAPPTRATEGSFSRRWVFQFLWPPLPLFWPPLPRRSGEGHGRSAFPRSPRRRAGPGRPPRPLPRPS